MPENTGQHAGAAAEGLAETFGVERGLPRITENLAAWIQRLDEVTIGTPPPLPTTDSTPRPPWWRRWMLAVKRFLRGGLLIVINRYTVINNSAR